MAMTEEAQSQHAQVNLSVYDWYIVLTILEGEVYTGNSAWQDSAVRLYGAIATQLSDEPVRIFKPPAPRASPFEARVIPPTLKSRLRDRFSREGP